MRFTVPRPGPTLPVHSGPPPAYACSDQRLRPPRHPVARAGGRPGPVSLYGSGADKAGADRWGAHAQHPARAGAASRAGTLQQLQTRTANSRRKLALPSDVEPECRKLTPPIATCCFARCPPNLWPVARYSDCPTLLPFLSCGCLAPPTPCTVPALGCRAPGASQLSCLRPLWPLLPSATAAGPGIGGAVKELWKKK